MRNVVVCQWLEQFKFFESFFQKASLRLLVVEVPRDLAFKACVMFTAALFGVCGATRVTRGLRHKLHDQKMKSGSNEVFLTW